MIISKFRLGVLIFVGGLTLQSARAAAGAIYADFQPDVPLDAFFAAMPNNTFLAGSSGVYRFDSNGHRLQEFQCPVRYGGYLPEALVSGDGSIFLYGAFEIGDQTFALAKLRSDGRLDEAFHPVDYSLLPGIGRIADDQQGGCFVSIIAEGRCEVVRVDRFGVPKKLFEKSGGTQPNVGLFYESGTLIVVGVSGIVRLDLDGHEWSYCIDDDLIWKHIGSAAFDPRFGLVVSGGVDAGSTYYEPNVIAEYRTDGRRIREFKPTIQVTYAQVCWDNHGRVLLYGIYHFTDTDRTDSEILNITAINSRLSLEDVGPSQFYVKRLTSDGSIDPTWSRALWFDKDCRVAPLSDDSLVVFGPFARVSGNYSTGAVRLSGEDLSTRTSQHSVRGYLDPKRPPLILGLVVEGKTSSDVLIRVAGSSLQKYGVDPAARTTRLAVYQSARRLVRTSFNTSTLAVNWVTSRVGAFPFDPNGGEAQVLLSLLPGSYTVVIDSLMDDAGEVLAEVYYP